MTKTLIFLDHFDSFTNNLASWFEAQNITVHVVPCTHGHQIVSFAQCLGVVLSPGPGHPCDYPCSLSFLAAIPKSLPVLGVCLGHQLLLAAQGAHIEQVSRLPRHGRQVNVRVTGKSRWLNVKSMEGLQVLYNSLGCRLDDPVFLQTMLPLAGKNGICLAAEHRDFPRLGVQFHPESFASPAGDSFLREFLGLLLC